MRKATLDGWVHTCRKCGKVLKSLNKRQMKSWVKYHRKGCK